MFTKRTSIESLYFVPYSKSPLNCADRARAQTVFGANVWRQSHTVHCTAMLLLKPSSHGVFAKPPCHIHSHSPVLSPSPPCRSVPPSLLIALFAYLSPFCSFSHLRSLDYIKLHLWLAGTSTIKSQPSSFVWKTKVPPPKRFYNNSTLLYFASLRFALCSSYVLHMTVVLSVGVHAVCILFGVPSLCRRYHTHQKKNDSAFTYLHVHSLLVLFRL